MQERYQMDPIILYSVNSRLAYNINKRYYHKHFVWCAIKFDTNDLEATERNNPETSNPIEFYKRYKTDINGILNDNHFKSSFLEERINGILTGLEENKSLIGDDNYNALDNEIKKQRKNGQIWKELEPLVYIIPYKLVKHKVEPVPPSKTARLLSDEYLIKDLKDEEFDVITNLWGIK